MTIFGMRIQWTWKFFDLQLFLNMQEPKWKYTKFYDFIFLNDNSSKNTNLGLPQFFWKVDLATFIMRGFIYRIDAILQPNLKAINFQNNKDVSTDLDKRKKGISFYKFFILRIMSYWSTLRSFSVETWLL